MLSLKDKTAEQNSISSATTLNLSNPAASIFKPCNYIYVCVLQTRDLNSLVSETTLKLEKEMKSPFKNYLWVLVLPSGNLVSES